MAHILGECAVSQSSSVLCCFSALVSDFSGFGVATSLVFSLDVSVS